ncbi:MAG: protein kinase, partial [Verrucomicrobia bacterium]|nr:protein kinase [Verrucomicrobiota bacterium]
GFELLDKVGAGGMATVWKARQLSLDRIVAIKILYSQYSRDPADVQRFQSEAQTAARLKHPGIVQVYDANSIDDMFYFVMEFVAGYTVGQWLKRSGALPLKDALLVAESVADALDYAWDSAGLIHCDVKPDNVLVDADGTVKVSDLGLARTMTGMTRDLYSEDVMGTPPYMAPEQIEGNVELDYRTDMYALGAMLYHLVTGEMPFAGYDMDKVMDLQLTHTIADPMELNADITAPVCWLIEVLMCKDPDGRPESWGQVRRDIERVKSGLRPASEAPPEGTSTVERSPKRMRAGTVSATMTASATEPPWKRIAKVGTIILVMSLGCWGMFHYRSKLALPVPEPDDIVLDAESMRQRRLLAEAESTYSEVLQWIADNPDQYDEGLRQLAASAEKARSMGWNSIAQRSRQEHAQLQERKRKAIDVQLNALMDQVEVLVSEGQREAALQLLRSQPASFAEETSVARHERGREIEAEITRMASEEEAARVTTERLDEIAARLISGNYLEAIAGLRDLLAMPVPPDEALALSALLAEIEGAQVMTDNIFQSFRQQIGQEVDVGTRSGTRLFKIMGVANGSVMVRRQTSGGTGGTLEFDLNYLSFRERVQRMGGLDQVGADLAVGLMALEAKSFSYARRYLGQVHPYIRDRLVAAVERYAADN